MIELPIPKSVEPTINDRFMIKLREFLGDSTTIQIYDNFSIIGITIVVQWQRIDKKFIYEQSFSYMSLRAYLIHPIYGIEDFVETLIKDISLRGKEIK